MTISTNYATPVWVNGYSCKNCTDVDYAKKYIDPAHPQSGPFGIDAKTDPTRVDKPAVAGSVSSNANSAAASGPPSLSTSGIGGLLDLTV